MRDRSSDNDISNECSTTGLCAIQTVFLVYSYFSLYTKKIYITNIYIWKEGSVLFNDTLNTFYLWLYGIRHMVKDHSDSEKGNLLPPHRLLLSINSKGSFICTIPQTG